MAAKRVIIYCRVSSGDKETDSLPSQEQTCLEYAKANDYEVVDVFREAESGQSGAKDAPMLEEAIRRAKLGHFDTLLCRDPDRFTRAMARGIIKEAELKAHGVSVQFVSKSFNSEYEDLLKTFEYWTAEQERLNSVKRMKAGRERKLGQGSFICNGKPPFGYSSERIDGLFRASIIEDQAKTVRLIFKWYTVDKMSATAIAKKLNRDKYPSSEGGKWAAWTVLWILRNESYIGRYHYGKAKVETKNILDNGRIVTRRTITPHDSDNHVIIEIPPIIDMQTWNKAQKRLAENKNDHVGRPPKYEYLLRKRVRCGNCDFATCADTKDRGRYKYYKCNAWRSGYDRISKDCIKSFDANRIDEIVWQWLEGLLKDKNLLKEKLEVIHQDWLARYEPLKTKQAHIEAELEKRKKAYDNLIELIISDGEYHLLADKKINLEREIDALEAERLNTDREMQTIGHILYQVDAGDAVELFEIDDKPLDFEGRRGYIEKFDVRAIITREPDGIWLEVTSDLGSMLRKLSESRGTILQLPPYYFIIREMILLEAR